MTIGTLVIVPCGRSKIWSRDPNSGPTKAQDAYIGAPFKVNRRYAETLGDRWIILSAKYGFIDPGCFLAGPYEVTFKKKSSGPITDQFLMKQVEDQRLNQFERVVGLGGKEYRRAIDAAFSRVDLNPEFPFAGLPIGKVMKAAIEAVEKENACDG